MGRARLMAPIPMIFVALILLLASSSVSGARARAATAGSIWRDVNPAGTLPLSRDGHWMADDSTTGEVLLFGGKGNGSHYFNDLWSYAPAANSWTELYPTGTLPPGRFGHAMVYDSTNRSVIIFGGVLGTTNAPANDLWSYSRQSNAWSDIKPSGEVPAARVYTSMVYDPATDEIILFGGFAGSDGLLADTWEYDSSANSWQRRDPGEINPAGRDFSAMVYDSAAKAAILFGGLGGSTGNIDGTVLNDTWRR